MMRLVVVGILLFLESSHAWLTPRIRKSGVSSSLHMMNHHDRPLFPHSEPPYLVVVTEEDSCANDTKLQESLVALAQAVSTNQVDLVSVRIDAKADERRVDLLVQELMEWTQSHRFSVVVSSDWINVGLRHKAQGVHVKESHRDWIPEIKRRWHQYVYRDPLIGTSAHSVSSAVAAWLEYEPDYFFVGTCYPTLTHPEKTKVEGPQLPGKVAKELLEHFSVRPKIIAIGGITVTNCVQPVEYGADGVATIRGVLQAIDPVETVSLMKDQMLHGMMRCTWYI